MDVGYINTYMNEYMIQKRKTKKLPNGERESSVIKGFRSSTNIRGYKRPLPGSMITLWRTGRERCKTKGRKGEKKTTTKKKDIFSHIHAYIIIFSYYVIFVLRPIFSGEFLSYHIFWDSEGTRGKNKIITFGPFLRV